MAIPTRETAVMTNSTAKAFKHCPRKTLYKYVDLLGPKMLRSKPLRRGTWFHALLEAKYKGESVTEAHKEMVKQFNGLFDEERMELGDLPSEMVALYKAYQWHYRKDESWTVHEVEIKVEAELPNGMQFQGKADMLIEDDLGLWVVDHKTHARLPRLEYRILDPQSVGYIWAMRQNNIPVQGFIWNYVVPTAPAPIKFTKATRNQPPRLMKRQPHTDYPTALRAAQEADMAADPEVQALLTRLQAERYDPDAVQTSPVFRRDIITKSDDAIDRMMAEFCHTAERFVEYPWADRERVERNVDRGCEWCEYRNLCIADLTGQDTEGIIRREFTQADPLAYYNEGTENAE